MAQRDKVGLRSALWRGSSSFRKKYLFLEFSKDKKAPLGVGEFIVGRI